MALNTAVTDTKWSPNFSSGRPGDPTEITAHHWGADGQTHQGVVDYLARADGDSSAHYVASAGRVTQLVHDYDRAWHAGSSGNPRGIGIELRPEMSDADFETAAQLVAAIRKEWGNLPLRGHKDHMNTACPGRWYSQLNRLSDRANAINNGVSKPTVTTPAAKPTATGFRLTPDGFWGPATTRAAQKFYGTPIDGIVSGQDASRIAENPGLGDGWEAGSGGSQLIMAIQKSRGVTADGILGPETIKAMQAYYGTPIDGRFDEESACIIAFQNALNGSLAKRGIK